MWWPRGKEQPQLWNNRSFCYFVLKLMRLQDLIGFELALSEPKDDTECRLVMYVESQRQAIYISEVFKPGQAIEDVSFDDSPERRSFLVAIQLLQNNSSSWNVVQEWIVDLRQLKPVSGKRHHGLIIKTHNGPVAVPTDEEVPQTNTNDTPQNETPDSNTQSAGSWLFHWGKALNTLNATTKEDRCSVSYSQLVDLWTLQHSIDEARAASLTFRSEVDRLIPTSSLPLEEKERALIAKLKRIRNQTGSVRAKTEDLKAKTSAKRHHQQELSSMLSASMQSLDVPFSGSIAETTGSLADKQTSKDTEHPINGGLPNHGSESNSGEPSAVEDNASTKAPGDKTTNITVEEPNNKSSGDSTDPVNGKSHADPQAIPGGEPVNGVSADPNTESGSDLACESTTNVPARTLNGDLSSTSRQNYEVSNKIKAEQSRLASELLKVFPIEPVGDGKFHFTILGLMLPSVFAINHYDTTQIGAALGFVAQVVVCISRYLDIALPYPITVFGSQSYITDNISQIKHGSNNFPLWTRGVLLYRVEYALYLLHKDIEQLLNWVKLAVVDLKQTLANLKNLLLVISNK